jgi:hypothetical protein
MLKKPFGKSSNSSYTGLDEESEDTLKQNKPPS